MVFWSIMALVTLKYVTVIMRADNRGEGGSLALLSLITENSRNRVVTWAISLLGIFAAALFYGGQRDHPGHLGALGGRGTGDVSPDFKTYVLPITLAILTGLFLIQSRGTGTVGLFFGPVMVGWFGVLGVLGAIEIARHPDVLAALNPLYAARFIVNHPSLAFLALGSVVLAVTGGEALYTDMGHFGRYPIRLAWFGFVMPALVLNYFGQGALLLNEPQAIESPFFHLGPHWALVPMVVLATLATVIASQAVISGAFSVARQAVQMGFLPRMLIVHTSGQGGRSDLRALHQLELYFGGGGAGAGLQQLVQPGRGLRHRGNRHDAHRHHPGGLRDGAAVALAPAGGGAGGGRLPLLVDIAFFAANVIKIPEGGWFPIVMGLISFTVLTTWRRGRKLVRRELAKQGIPMPAFLPVIGSDIHRVAAPRCS